MELMDTILASTRDSIYTISGNPIYSTVGCIAAGVCLLKFYFKFTAGVCDSNEDMQGKTILITGGNTGIGKTTAEDLARRNARVILACRNMEKARRAADEIIASTGNKNVFIKQLDLSSFESVRKCAEDVLETEEKLHVLINNAGLYAGTQKTTEDGCETVMQSNHLGHFLLTILLLDLLKKSIPSRIINVSSEAYKYNKLDINDMAGEKSKSQLELYARSKLANVYFTTELSTRLANTGVTVNVLHPGLVKTDLVLSSTGFVNILTHFLQLIAGKTSEEGAQTTIYLAVHPEVAKTTGKYFADCKEKKLVGEALNKSLAKQFFEVSEKIVGSTYKWT